MIKKIVIISLSFLVFFGTNCWSDTDNTISSTDEILTLAHSGSLATPCAAKIFLDALNKNSDTVSADASEYVARVWAKNIMQSPDVLTKVLECPEIKYLSPTQTINFTPIVYTFPNTERTLTINYSTQPKVMHQHILMANKRSLPNGDINPKLNNPDDPGIYINTEPAWYGILVVQHDSLSEFVGPNKNNTLSLKYINDNIDKIYPHGFSCTSRSAWADDDDTINIATKQTVQLGEKDSNDYYVAGDIDLEWVMYAEIAGDILLTVATSGLGEAALAWAKGANATRATKNLQASIKALRGADEVKDYISLSNKVARHTDDIAKLTKNADKATDLVKQLKSIDQTKNSTEYATKMRELTKIVNETKKVDPSVTLNALTDANKMSDKIKTMKKTVKNLSKNADDLVKSEKKVKQYTESMKAADELLKYRRDLNAYKNTTGNFITRSLKALKSFNASNKGAKEIAKASKLARAGMSSKSARLGDWLFESTLKHGARLARFERDASMLGGLAYMIGEFYDHTSATSKEFSNGIEFKPLGLLSADDLDGYDNVVNYGMWLMWQGNSTDPADDDAAYLQAMDFAAKFHYNLEQVQEQGDANCNVDIYVVRPLIRLDETNINDPHGEMFYLFMNDVPWTTAEQFGEKVPDVKEWERVQQQKFSENPRKGLPPLPSKPEAESETGPEQTTDSIDAQEIAE